MKLNKKATDPEIIPKINLSIPKNLFKGWPMISNFERGKIVIAYQKTRTKGFLNKNLIFLLFNQSIVQITKDIKTPPIQVPEIKSSILKYRQSPTPPAIVIVQTGHILNF